MLPALKTRHQLTDHVFFMFSELDTVEETLLPRLGVFVSGTNLDAMTFKSLTLVGATFIAVL